MTPQINNNRSSAYWKPLLRTGFTQLPLWHDRSSKQSVKTTPNYNCKLSSNDEGIKYWHERPTRRRYTVFFFQNRTSGQTSRTTCIFMCTYLPYLFRDRHRRRHDNVHSVFACCRTASSCRWGRISRIPPKSAKPTNPVTITAGAVDAIVVTEPSSSSSSLISPSSSPIRMKARRGLWTVLPNVRAVESEASAAFGSVFRVFQFIARKSHCAAQTPRSSVS